MLQGLKAVEPPRTSLTLCRRGWERQGKEGEKREDRGREGRGRKGNGRVERVRKEERGRDGKGQEGKGRNGKGTVWKRAFGLVKRRGLEGPVELALPFVPGSSGFGCPACRCLSTHF